MILGRNAGNITFISKRESSSPIYVNNILEREKQEETPIKWGKKRLKIFP